MTEVAIRVEGLSKLYHIGAEQRTYDRLGEKIRDTIATPVKRAVKLLRGDSSGASDLEETIWALKEADFVINRGEVVGIIGSNGAGKSTLLKILSRITEPTEGFADIFGRVGSLLEVGTGFHPELTGRENIFLNGAILGMRRQEINERFAEIVEFSEIGKFLDTPVKHYSSGMYVRLAFSVAAHLEPEILLVDEVLAVGDAAFQKKCLGKMGDAVKSGRTVIFVSHNMGAIQRLCERVIWLSDGSIRAYGPTTTIVQEYLEHSLRRSSSLKSLRDQKIAEEKSTYYADVRLISKDGSETITFHSGDPLIIETTIRMKDGWREVQCGYDIDTIDGTPVVNTNSRILGHSSVKIRDRSRIRWLINELRLMPGRYSINLRLKDTQERDFIDNWQDAITFQILATDIFKTGQKVASGRGVTYLPTVLEVCE